MRIETFGGLEGPLPNVVALYSLRFLVREEEDREWKNHGPAASITPAHAPCLYRVCVFLANNTSTKFTARLRDIDTLTSPTPKAAGT